MCLLGNPTNKQCCLDICKKVIGFSGQIGLCSDACPKCDCIAQLCPRVLLFACLLVCLFACLLVCLFAYLLFCLFVCLFVCLLPCLFVCLFACLLTCLFACLFVCLFKFASLLV